MKRIWVFGVAWLLVWPFLLGCSNNQAELKRKQAEAIRGVGEAYLAEGKYSAALREW